MSGTSGWGDLRELDGFALSVHQHHRALTAGFTIGEIARWGLASVTAGLTIPALIDPAEEARIREAIAEVEARRQSQHILEAAE